MKDPNNTTPYWKKGGRFESGCMSWEIIAGPINLDQYENLEVKNWKRKELGPLPYLS